MIPACSHTGTPLHFHSSTTSGSACLISVRTRAIVSPRQSFSSLILASISSEGECSPFPSFELLLLVFIARSSRWSLTFLCRVIGWLASPRRRAELHRARRPHGCRDGACPCSLIRRAGEDAATC